jgi:hypothetical protein
MTWVHYEAESYIENRLDVPLKPFVGINHGRKWPRFKTNDKDSCCKTTSLKFVFTVMVKNRKVSPSR